MLSAHQAINSLKLSKLKRHKDLKHKENTDSAETFIAERAHYDMRTIPALRLYITSQPLQRDSYQVFLIIAKAKEAHTAGEKLIEPCAVKNGADITWSKQDQKE